MLAMAVPVTSIAATSGSTSPVLVAPSASAVLPGWRLPTLGPKGRQWIDGRSGDGRTQILVEPDVGEHGPTKRTATKFAVLTLDAKGKQVGRERIITLNGRFGFDALSNAGTRLFVTESRDVEAPGTYRVRMIDLATGTLDPRILSDRPIDSEAYAEAGPDDVELMAGTAIARVRNSVRTHWIFTLYDATGKHPFIHALNTEGFALCLDLPSHGKPIADLASSWTLSASSTTMTVANTKLGKTWSYNIGTSRIVRQ